MKNWFHFCVSMKYNSTYIFSLYHVKCTLRLCNSYNMHYISDQFLHLLCVQVWRTSFFSLKFNYNGRLIYCKMYDNKLSCRDYCVIIMIASLSRCQRICKIKKNVWVKIHTLNGQALAFESRVCKCMIPLLYVHPADWCLFTRSD